MKYSEWVCCKFLGTPDQHYGPAAAEPFSPALLGHDWKHPWTPPLLQEKRRPARWHPLAQGYGLRVGVLREQGLARLQWPSTELLCRRLAPRVCPRDWTQEVTEGLLCPKAGSIPLVHQGWKNSWCFHVWLDVYFTIFFFRFSRR